MPKANATPLSPAAYWWENAPLTECSEAAIASASDVIIVGAGYTGTSAAICLARAGYSVQLFDAQKPGEGASTRNGGITSGHLRFGATELARRFGETRAAAMLREAQAAREDLYAFIRNEKIDCDLNLSGRFTGAMNARDYDALAREAEFQREKLGVEAYSVPAGEQHAFLGTEFYRGGSVQMDIGGLDPAKFHAGLLRIAREAGVTVLPCTRVEAIARQGAGFSVRTARGTSRARHVIVATNGYADRLDPWLRRRVVPVRSRVIVTEEIAPQLMQKLMPRQMMCIDTRSLSYYYRPTPDGRRILFGGRDGTFAGDPRWPIRQLRQRLVEIFPELEATEISHSWFGYVAMNRDLVPRIFNRNGVWYATSFCGSGVVWARWAGNAVARRIMGGPDGSAFEFRPPAAVPFFNGTPWFMPATFLWLNAKDMYRAWHR